MNDHTPGIPDLGSLTGPKPRIGVQFHALVRSLDADGTFEARRMVRAPNGQMVAATEREQYLSAEDLIAEIRTAVREEVARMLVDAGVITAASAAAGGPAPVVLLRES